MYRSFARDVRQWIGRPAPLPTWTGCAGYRMIRGRCERLHTILHHFKGEKTAMIDLYFWPTGNGKKIIILLEELGLPYTVKPINIGRGDQLAPEFLKISPNGR